MISVENCTWFYCENLPVTVYTGDGQKFYQTTKGSKGFFSLPKGVYSFSKPVKKVEKRYRKIPKLPEPQRYITKPEKWKLILCRNSAKCSIKLESGKVYFDRDLWNKLNKLQRLFILLHEFGHYFYKSEHLCDLYAKVKLLEQGYNRSQVAGIDFKILTNSPSSFERKCYTFGKIVNGY